MDYNKSNREGDGEKETGQGRAACNRRYHGLCALSELKCLSVQATYG
jgi:hypothetical protein